MGLTPKNDSLAALQLQRLIKSDVWPLYIAIILAAKSRRHLEKLHSQLPHDCQVLADEWGSVIEFWRQLYNNKPPTGRDSKPSSVITALMLSSLISDRGLRKHYVERLDEEDRTKIDDSLSLRYCGADNGLNFVYPHQDRRGHFFILLASIPPEIELSVVINSNHTLLGVGLGFWEDDLTSQITTELLKLPPSQINHEGMTKAFSSHRGSRTDFWYTLPAEDFIEHVDTTTHIHYGSKYLYVAKQSFMSALSAGLHQLGLPVIGISFISSTNPVSQQD